LSVFSRKISENDAARITKLDVGAYKCFTMTPGNLLISGLKDQRSQRTERISVVSHSGFFRRRFSHSYECWLNLFFFRFSDFNVQYFIFLYCPFLVFLLFSDVSCAFLEPTIIIQRILTLLHCSAIVLIVRTTTKVSGEWQNLTPPPQTY